MALVLPDTHANQSPAKFIQILESLRTLAAIATAARRRAAGNGVDDDPAVAGFNAPGGDVERGGCAGSSHSDAGSDSDPGREEPS